MALEDMPSQRTRGNPQLGRKPGGIAVGLWCWGFVSDRRYRRSRSYAGLLKMRDRGLP